jgi:hypothetical protein
MQCADVIDEGVYCGANTDFPTCVNVERCKGHNSCFWRNVHQLPAGKYRRKNDEQKQGELSL